MRIVLKFRTEILISLTIILLYFLTRLVNLTIIPVFVDEAIYTRWSQVILSDQSQWFIPLSDGKQPLFMWLGTIPLRFFHNPLFAERLVSVVAGFFTMIGLWLLVRELFNKRTAFLASFLYILCPFAMMYDRLAVADGLVTTFFVYTVLVSVYLVKKITGDFAFLLGWVLGGGLLTKSTAALSFLILPFSFLIKPQKAKLHKLVGFWLLAGISGFLLYNVLRLSPLYFLIGQRTGDFIFTPREVLTHPIDPFLFRFKDVAGWLGGYLTWPVFILSIIGAVLLLNKQLNLGIFLLAWFLIPLLIEMEIAKGFTPRYFVFIAPIALIFAAFLVDWIWKKIKWSKLALLSVLILPAIIFEYQLLTNPQIAPIPKKEKDGYLEQWSAGYGLVEISNYLKEQAKSGLPITVVTEGTQGYGTLPDGLQIYLRDEKNIAVGGVNWTVVKEVPKNLMEDAKSHPAYLVVNENRFFDGKNTHLKLLASYTKANGLNPLLFYQITP